MMNCMKMTLSLALVWSVGCATEPEPRVADGFTIPLVAVGTSGTSYRLRDASFEIVGAENVTLSSGDEEIEFLSLALVPGAYTIELLPGWQLWRSENGTDTLVTASLHSNDPQMFTVTPTTTAQAIFNFRLHDEQVQLGGVQVGFDVQDGPPCDAWEVRYDLAGSTFEYGTGVFLDDALTGMVTVRFPDDGNGQPGNDATLIALDTFGEASFFFFDVAVDQLAGRSNPLSTVGECGVAQAPIVGGTAAWTTASEVRTLVECNGCNANGTDDTAVRSLGAFTFSANRSSFSAPSTQMFNSSGDFYMATLQGAEVSRLCVYTPSCP